MTATWTTITDQVANTVVTAARLNALRDNLDWLKSPPSARMLPSADQSVSSTSYVDLFSSLSLTTKGGAIMLCGTIICVAPAGQSLYLDVVLDGVSQTGLGWGVARSAIALHQIVPIMWVTTAQAAAAHTIKIQAKVSAGTASFIGAAGAGQSFLYAREV
jgi:hypothetical protein